MIAWFMGSISLSDDDGHLLWFTLFGRSGGWGLMVWFYGPSPSDANKVFRPLDRMA
jgi:hypothetical protein